MHVEGADVKLLVGLLNNSSMLQLIDENRKGYEYVEFVNPEILMSIPGVRPPPPPLSRIISAHTENVPECHALCPYTDHRAAACWNTCPSHLLLHLTWPSRSMCIAHAHFQAAAADAIMHGTSLQASGRGQMCQASPLPLMMPSHIVQQLGGQEMKGNSELQSPQSVHSTLPVYSVHQDAACAIQYLLSGTKIRKM